MNLLDQIQSDTKDAMRNRDRQRSAALRMLSAALKNAELEEGKELSEEEQQVVLRRQLKQREESAEAFQKAGRQEQAEHEAAEAEIVRGYLPAPMDPEMLQRIVDQAIEDTGASGMKDMGNAMGRAMELSEGRAEGRELSALVRARLQQ